VLDEKPFIVMPYLKNGNALDYVRRHPDCNRLHMVSISMTSPQLQPGYSLYAQLRDISLGLHYLHSKKVIHGDLKAVRIVHLSMLNEVNRIG
jgi:serine/threonine protein kinase